jgi:hypothetical protein
VIVFGLQLQIPFVKNFKNMAKCMLSVSAIGSSRGLHNLSSGQDCGGKGCVD